MSEREDRKPEEPEQRGQENFPEDHILHPLEFSHFEIDEDEDATVSEIKDLLDKMFPMEVVDPFTGLRGTLVRIDGTLPNYKGIYKTDSGELFEYTNDDWGE
jgi:hypothetical protein